LPSPFSRRPPISSSFAPRRTRNCREPSVTSTL
jgi:hypothetical protein